MSQTRIARELARQLSLSSGIASKSQELWLEGRMLTSLLLDLGVYSAARTLVAVGVRPAPAVDAGSVLREAAGAVTRAAAALPMALPKRPEAIALRKEDPAVPPAEARV